MTDKKTVVRALPTTVIAGKEVELLLDSHEAAAVLGVHPRTLQRMAQRGQIAGVQVGKLWRFRASSLLAWIDHQMAS
jgi:excisionase family DNA binding protein